MRLHMLLATALAVTIPSIAQAAPSAQPPRLFAAPALSDDALAQVYGTGPGDDYRRNIRGMVETEARSFAIQTGTIVQVTFDNWFAEVGSRLIAENAFGLPPGLPQ